MSCVHCKSKEAYLYDTDECDIFRIENILYFRYIDNDEYENVHGIEIIYCPWCGTKVVNK